MKNIVKISAIALAGSLAACSSGDRVLPSATVGSNITSSEVVSATKGYLVRYNAWQDNTLFEFNPSTGTVEQNPVSGFDGVNISSLELSPEGKLWVGIGSVTTPEISVLDVSNNFVEQNIGLRNNPAQIAFSANISVTACDFCAVIAGVDSGYSSSWVSVADAEPPYSIIERYAEQAESDIRVATNSENFYRIGRSNQHNITKYEFDNPAVEQWQFSVGVDANPYDIIFASPTKAYVLRYGTGEIWIVDPSVTAAQSANFKLGEIDLSAYDNDGVPEMSAGVIRGGRLYVVMQAMDITTGPWTPGQAYMAVIDTATDTEIDVSPSDPLNGLALTVKNPVDIDVFNDNLYITGAGRYPSGYYGTAAEFTGGIEEVNMTTFAQRLVIDD